ncbi:Ig-like domain-containing protein [Thioalkalivibrio sp. ALJT]|uniref:Ig-like domain-containing protein n=1 Tax=Thioalkalivibrio sp. ALJT TaxID=1158146 RepID=UPI0003826D39|nr:Ig-like domain-containing protein [Thioalkalivibrio sp. ALJT]
MAVNMQAQLVDKSSGATREVALDQLSVGENQVVQLPIGPETVAAFDQQGMDLVVTLRSGETFVVEGFFTASDELRNELVLEDSSGVLWWGQYEQPWESFALAEISEVGQLVDEGGSGVSALGLIAGAVAVGGLAAAAGGSSSSSSAPADDSGDAPAAPVIDEANAGGLSGTADPDTTITLKDDEGEEVATAETDGDGNWSIPAEDFPDGDPDGFEGEVTATDDEGNESDATPVGPIDGQIPDAPVVEEENAAGISGTAEAGTTITLTDGDGEVVATTETDAEGNWSVPAEDFPGGDPDGFEGEVTATDDAGNESAPAAVGPIDGQIPDAPVVEEENAAGVSGTAEAGTTITLKDDEGEEVATTETDAEGNWSVPAEDFPGGDPDGFEGEVTATDDEGNESDATPVGPIDGQIPDAPVVEEENAAGVSGTAEAGTTITLKDDEGEEVATTETDAEGNWSVPAEDFPGGDPDGFEGEVTATDDAGNESAPASVGPIDGQIPDAPVVEEENAAGVSGTAEAGTTITLKDDEGEEVATAETDAEGNWSIPAADFPDQNPAGFSGQVTATDDAGNESEPAGVEFSDQPDEPLVTQQDNIAIAGEAGADASEVELLDDDDQVLLSTEVEDGAWSFSADDLDAEGTEILGYEGSVRALSEDGFTSEPVDVAVNSIFAENFGGVSELSISGIEDQFDVEPLDDLVLQGGLLGIGVQDTDSLMFEVDDGEVGALRFDASSGSVLTLLDQGFEIELFYREDSDAEFESLGTLEQDPGLLGLDLLGLAGTDEDVSEAGLQPGEYELELRRSGGVELLSGDVALENVELLTADPDSLDPSAGTVEDVQAFEGNLADSIAVSGDPDFEDVLVGVRHGSDGDFIEFDNDGSIELDGDFGTLTVDDDGSLRYEADPDAGNIGETDRFEYKVEDPVSGDIDHGQIDMEVGFFVT